MGFERSTDLDLHEEVRKKMGFENIRVEAEKS